MEEKFIEALNLIDSEGQRIQKDFVKKIEKKKQKTMIKFIPQDTSVVFSEIPDEITLAINISNCQNNCAGCHSAYLKENIGEELTEEKIDELIKKNYGITCICFMGEGNDQQSLFKLLSYIKEHKGLKIALYSGRVQVEEAFLWNTLDYLKIGPYISELGPLNKPTTNQRLYKRMVIETKCYGSGHAIAEKSSWLDITHKFWK